MFKSIFWTVLYSTPFVYFGLMMLIAETDIPFLVGFLLALGSGVGIFALILNHDSLYNQPKVRWTITVGTGAFGLWGLLTSLMNYSGALVKHLIVSASVVGVVIILTILISYGAVVSDLYAKLLRARGKVPEQALRVFSYFSINLPVSRKILLLRILAYALVFATVIAVVILLPGKEFLGVKLIVWAGVFSSLLVLDGILTVETLKKGIAEQELETAHQMQMSLMPASDPVLRGYDISGICRPAGDVGGDYFDFVWLNRQKTKLGIALADVAGKAMNAAFTAALTSGMLYSELDGNRPVREILTRMNTPMFLRTDRRVFTAFLFASLDLKARRLSYGSAGQAKPIVRRRDALMELESKGPRIPLGVQPKVSYLDSRFTLKRGDVVLFYTDGILRQTNERNEEFGVERLRAALQSMKPRTMNANEIVQDLLKSVARFFAANEQNDDITLVVLKVR